MINFTSKTPQELFEGLSEADGRFFWGYNKGFEVNFDGKDKYSVVEAEKGGLNPFKMRSDDDRKLKTANNIKALLQHNNGEFAKKIVTNRDYDVDQVVKTLLRCKGDIMASVGNQSIKNVIDVVYNEAIAYLNNAKKQHTLEHLKISVDPKGKTKWETTDFLNKMSKTWWFAGSPNFKMHLNKEKGGEITPYTSEKQYAFTKYFYGKKASDVEKRATIENLEILLNQNKSLIKAYALNAKGIKANVERLAGRMTANMDPNSADTDEIKKSVNNIGSMLDGVQSKIDASVSPMESTLSGSKLTLMTWVAISAITYWVSDSTVPLPFQNLPASLLAGGVLYAKPDRIVTEGPEVIADIIYNGGAWVSSYVKEGVKSQAVKVKNVVARNTPQKIKTALQTVKYVGSCTYDMLVGLKDGVVWLGKLPVRGINDWRRVSA